jgi:DedD protein
MPLPSFLQRGPKKADPERRNAPSPAESDDPGPAQAARTRARRRLTGAVVLLAVGVVGFPLLFETKPRPIGVDVPIQTAAGPQGARGSLPPQPVAVAPLPRTQPSEPVRPPEDAGREQPASPSPAAPPMAAPPVATAGAAPAAAASLAARGAASAAAPRAAVAASAPRVADSARARALLDGAAAGRTAAASQPADQPGADARSGDDRAVPRVRVGPFEERGDADAAARKLKAAGLPANILAL